MKTSKMRMAGPVISGLIILGSLSAVFGYSSSNTVNITMTVFASGFLSVTNINGGGSIVDMGAVVEDTTNVSPAYGNLRGIFRNNGSMTATYSLKGMITNAGFTLISARPVDNQVRLGVIAGNWENAYVPYDFSDTDCLSASYQDCSTTVFAKDAGDAENLKGYNVAPGSDRNFLFGVCYGGGLPDGSGIKIRMWVRAQ